MRLLINTSSVFKGGSAQVAKSFLRECCQFEEHAFGVVLGPGLSNAFRTEDFPADFRFYVLTERPAQRVLSLRSPSKRLREIESDFAPDVVFTTSGPSYWRPVVPHLMGFNLPHHVYPDSPYFSRVLNRRGRLRWRAKSLLIHHYTSRFADAWVVQTDDVNDRLRRWIRSDQVFTVPNTISGAYALELQEEARGRSSSKGDKKEFRLLVLSSYYPHKNLEILNDIIVGLRKRNIDDIRFTMTLPKPDFEAAISQDNRAWIQNLGPQQPEECPRLYLESDAVLLPSLLECFSANYVEAMAMRRPMITTNLGFARTVCGDAALYFEPMDGADALGKILELRHNTSLQQRLVEAGRRELRRFGTATERASAYLDICQRLVNGREYTDHHRQDGRGQ